MNDLPPESLTICLQLFLQNPLTNHPTCGIIIVLKDRVKQATRLVRSKQPRVSTTENLPPLKEREETTMTITTIICTILAITLIAGYAVLLHNSKEPELTDEELAEVSVEREWWNAN